VVSTPTSECWTLSASAATGHFKKRFAFRVFLADLQHYKRLMSVALNVSGRGLPLIKPYLMQKISSIWSFSLLLTFILLRRSC